MRKSARLTLFRMRFYDARTCPVHAPPMNAFRTIGQVRRYIKRRLSAGVTASAIARELGVSKPNVKRLLTDYPGPRVARQLGIPELCPLCKRPQRGARRVGDAVYFTGKDERGRMKDEKRKASIQ